MVGTHRAHAGVPRSDRAAHVRRTGGPGWGSVSRLLVPMPSAVLTGALFALFMVVGKSFAETGSIDGMAAAPFSALMRFALFTAVFGEALSVLFRALDGLSGRAPARRDSAFPGRHPFAFCALAMAVCWLFYLAVFFPGSLPYDGVRSLNQFMTDVPLENHHPVLMNMLYAVLFRFGRLAGGLLGQGEGSPLSPDNLGVLSIVLFQAAVCVLAFAGVVRFVDRSGVPRGLAWLALAFFALFPAWGVFAQDAFKDTLFNGVFAFFVLACAWTLFPRLLPECLAARPTSPWIVLGLAALAVCLTRNNGVYLVVPTLLCILLAARRRQAAFVFAGVLVAYAATTSLLWPAIGVNMSGNAKEMLSIPFQQTARCVATYPDDVTEEERAAIDAVLPYDQLAELYLPDLSDPVKETYKLDNSKIPGSEAYADEHPDALRDYFRAWLSMGLRHPGCYVQATVANTYAYFYPGVLVGQDIARPILSLYTETGPINDGEYRPHYVMPESVRTAVEGALVASYDLPVAKWFWSPALYVWALLASCAYALHAGWNRRRTWARMLAIALPSLMLVLTVVAGPLNGHLRYMLPVAAALPVLQAALTFRDGPDEGAAVAPAARVGRSAVRRGGSPSDPNALEGGVREMDRGVRADGSVCK